MFERLDASRSLTANQWRIVIAAILGDMLEFFDYFLIGFVLAFKAMNDGTTLDLIVYAPGVEQPQVPG
jgi:hypothetical protein